MPPEQRPVLVFAGDREEAEDHRDDENIVHRQRFLDDKGGEVEACGLGPDLPPDEAREKDAECDVKGREFQAFRDADFRVALVQDAKVENQQHEDDCEEGEPEPERLAQK